MKSKIKSFEDACSALDVKPALPVVTGLPEEHHKAIAAYYKLVIIAKALNEGWTPDWENSNQYKWYPWFNMKAGFGFSRTYYGGWSAGAGTGVGSRLCFKTEELAEYAGKQFIEIYRDFLTLT